MYEMYEIRKMGEIKMGDQEEVLLMGLSGMGGIGIALILIRTRIHSLGAEGEGLFLDLVCGGISAGVLTFLMMQLDSHP